MQRSGLKKGFANEEDQNKKIKTARGVATPSLSGNPAAWPEEMTTLEASVASDWFRLCLSEGRW